MRYEPKDVQRANKKNTDRQKPPTHCDPPTPRLPLTVSLLVCVTGVFPGEGTSVRSLPVFLSGMIQQCFFSMPGNTFQETQGGGRWIERETERERGGKMLISHQLEADNQHEAQTKSTEPCSDQQLQSGTIHTFLTPFASKSAAPTVIYLTPFFWCEQWSTKWWSRWGYMC